MFVPKCSGPPDPPANLSSMVVTNDVNPVTVMFTWSGLVGEIPTGIPSNGNSSSLNYTLSIEGTSRSVTTTLEMVEMVNLTSCVSYNASLSASNKVLMGSPSTVEFSTSEKGMLFCGLFECVGPLEQVQLSGQNWTTLNTNLR